MTAISFTFQNFVVKLVKSSTIVTYHDHSYILRDQYYIMERSRYLFLTLLFIKLDILMQRFHD